MKTHLSILEHLLSIASFLLTLIFIPILLRSRKSPGSTFAWLLVVTAIPYVGIPLYLFFSGRKIPRKNHQKAALFSRTPFDETPTSATRTERILLSAGLPAKRDNTSTELLETGEKAYETLLRLFDQAHRFIYVETFIFGNDAIAHTLQECLAKKAREGVKVRVLVDALGSAWMNHPSFDVLRQAGGEIAYFMPLLHLPFRGHSNLRNHRKMVIVDGTEAVLGGTNLARQYLGPSPDPERWLDLSLRLSGGSAQDLEEIFLSDWAFASGTPLEKPSEETLSEHASPRLPREIQIAASGPDVPSDAIYDALLSSIFQAKSRIWISTPYFIPDDALTKALELACKRGVDLRILLPLQSNHFLADMGRGSFIRQLQAAGGKFYFFPQMIHAKAMVFDNAYSFIGSANIDLRSLLLNYEVGAFLYSEKEIEACVAWFEPLFARSSVRLHRAGFFRDLAEGVGRLLSPLL